MARPMAARAARERVLCAQILNCAAQLNALARSQAGPALPAGQATCCPRTGARRRDARGPRLQAGLLAVRRGWSWDCVPSQGVHNPGVGSFGSASLCSTRHLASARPRPASEDQAWARMRCRATGGHPLPHRALRALTCLPRVPGAGPLSLLARAHRGVVRRTSHPAGLCRPKDSARPVSFVTKDPTRPASGRQWPHPAAAPHCGAVAPADGAGWAGLGWPGPRHRGSSLPAGRAGPQQQRQRQFLVAFFRHRSAIRPWALPLALLAVPLESVACGHAVGHAAVDYGVGHGRGGWRPWRGVSPCVARRGLFVLIIATLCPPAWWQWVSQRLGLDRPDRCRGRPRSDLPCPAG